MILLFLVVNIVYYKMSFISNYGDYIGIFRRRSDGTCHGGVCDECKIIHSPTSTKCRKCKKALYSVDFTDEIHIEVDNEMRPPALKREQAIGFVCKIVLEQNK
jgi:hypothetical protein